MFAEPFGSVRSGAVRAVYAYFRQEARKFAGTFKEETLQPPTRLGRLFTHSRRPQSRPTLESWMGRKIPKQLSTYVNKSRESLRQTYKEQAEPHLTPPQYKSLTFSSNKAKIRSISSLRQIMSRVKYLLDFFLNVNGACWLRCRTFHLWAGFDLVHQKYFASSAVSFRARMRATNSLRFSSGSTYNFG